MSKRQNYKVVSDELNLVLFVKGYKLEEEKKLYESIRKKIETAEAPINIENYKEFIVKKFLIDSDTFIEGLPEDTEEKNEIIDAAYEAVIGLYPPFSLEFVCQDLNTDVFFSGVKGSILRHMQDSNSFPPRGGERHPVNLSSIEDLLDLEKYLGENIIGQQNAVSSLIKSMKLMASGLAKHSSFLFVGRTGVGKSQLSKLVGEKFSGNFYKVNCAEYAGGHEYAKLIGAPPGYVGHSEKSLLAEKAEQSNRWVFLFDEIEKAHHKLYDFLLSLLDEGTCTDNMGVTLDFSESIFIFTSNQGVSDIKTERVGFKSGEEEVTEKVTSDIIDKAVKRHFSPEFLNRLDSIVHFNNLTKPQIKEIVSLQLKNLPIVITDPLINFIVEGGYSAEYGARNIARFIKNNVSIQIADSILHKLVPKKDGELYTPRIVKDGVKIINTEKYIASSDTL
tara:strand:+ start:1379 stop:2722 length:1344 start_codon:yes stop_codon:yes gene_type:complete